MSESQYATVMGFIQQFGSKQAVEVKEVNGQTLHEFTIRTVGTGQPLVKVTLWGEYAESAPLADLKGGVFVAADGKYRTNAGTDGRVYHNLSASAVAVVQPLERKETARTPAAVGSLVAAVVAPF